MVVLVSYILAFFTLALACMAGSPSLARAQSREQLIQNYIDQQQKNPPLYQAPPINHLVPNFNTITYAAALDYQQVEILPSDSEGNVQKYLNSEASLSLKGYTVSPHLAMSLKRVGLGLSVETMHREAIFNSSYTSSGESTYYSQLASVDASGYGFNISFLPIPKFSKNIKVATILGTKTFNATHRSGSFQPVTGSGSPSRRYTVQKHEIGLNVGLQLLKAFRLTPWANYGLTVLNTDSESNGASYEKELELFWKEQPDFRYGINAGITLDGFELSIGGILGMLGNLNGTPDFIKDKSLSLTLSWDQKGS